MCPGFERLARVDHLVSRRENRHAGLRVHLDVDDAQGGDSADAARVEHVARLQHRLARADVGALSRHVLARIHGAEDAHRVVGLLLGVLDHHDRIGAVRNGRAGRDLGALVRADRPGRHLAREDGLDPGQGARIVRRRTEGVGRPHGIPVHRRPGKRRHVGLRLDGAGDHAAARRVDADPLGPLDGPDGPVDQVPRCLERDRFPNRPHAVHCALLRAGAWAHG